ncbi:MAG: alpha/beta hydrolase [Beijerinckiaceae bacterium]|nr:alpha/beta hydrolase [Beijerinckiaceae bacterium]
MRFLFPLMALLLAGLPVQAGEILPELGTDAVLDRPAGKPRGSIILMGGGNGDLGITASGEITSLMGNSLIRNRRSFAAAGFATLSLSSSGSPSSAIAAMRKIARPVVVVGTSRAATRMHRALEADALVITSGMLDHFQSNVGSAEALPPTLVVHHRQDSCRVTLPGLVPPFQQWGGARVRVVWLDGGRDEGDPCQARGHHGFAGIDGRMVGAVTGFARGIRPR